MEILDPDIEM